MKKFFKIFGITLGSIVGLLLIVVCIVLWLVFTPERITKIVNDNADKFLNAEVHLDRAELTFFSSFPRFMVKINNIDVVNPLGLENDTVVHATAVALDVNVKELLKNHNLIVEEAIINDAKIFAYSDSNICNYNIVKSSEEDTTASSFVINNIVVQNVTLKNSNIVFFDKSMGINAKLVNTNANLGIAMHDSSSMSLLSNLQTDDLFFALDTTIYANNIPADMSAQFTYDFVNSKFILPECELKSGDNLLKTHLVIDLADSTKTGLDIHFSLNTPNFPKMMTICPPDYKSYADGFDIQGALDVQGTLKGNVSDKEYPLVDLQLNTYHLQVAADFLPDTLRDIALTANILVDMNVEKNSSINITNVKAKILNSDVAFVGKISDLFGDMLIKGIINIPKADLKTVAAILPKDMDIKLLGNASGKVNIDSRLSYLTDMKLEKINVSGKINLKNIDFAMPKDKLFAKLDNSTLDFQLNAKNNDKLPNFIRATFVSDNLDAQFAENKIKAVKPNLNIAMGDIRKDISDIYADFAFADIDLQGDSIALLTQNVVGKAQIQPSKRKNVSNRYSLELKANNTDAVAFLNKLNVNSLDIKLKGAVKENENDFLLKYLASGDMKISGLKATLKDIDEKIEIPSIRFNFTPNDYHIQEGKVVLGNSDFALNGDIYNLRKFLKDKDTLNANLTFNSNMIDINELLGIYSKMGLETEESIAQEQSATVQPNSTNGKSNTSEKSAAPANTFLVPTKLNITFTPRIKEIKFGKESIHDFKGDVVIRNGQMALNNIDMRTPEARLNFTALYRSPRKNNLFLALSMHLVDIKIHALINTLPDIDTILPMLKSFAGEADFHFAVQTNLDSNYNIKFSTLTGAVSIQGEDLVVMDGETFSTLAKYLMFKKKTENKIDSLYAVFTIYKNEIDVYPILVSMDKYQVVVGGRHNIDMSFDYHADLIKSPIGFTVGVDVYGNLDKLKYRIFSKPRYPADFRPSSRSDLKDNQDKIKNIIRNSMLIGFE